MNGRNALVLAILIGAAACKPAEPPKTPLGAGAGDAGQPADPRTILTPAAKADLDSGNVLFRAQKYDAALAAYRAAAKEVPLNAAPYYGIYMAAQKLNNKALADSALQNVQAREGSGSPMFADSNVKKAHLQAPAAKKP